MHPRLFKTVSGAMSVLGTFVLTGCQQVSLSEPVDAPAAAVDLHASIDDSAPLTCRELGGGYVYERRADGLVGLFLRAPATDDEALAEALQARKANGWTDELYDVLWHIGRDYDVASRAGFSGTPDELDALSRRATALLEQMPPCVQP